MAEAKAEEDPFGCFSGDDDDNDNTGHDANTKQPGIGPQNTRDPLCGVLTFHSGVEQSLLHYVQREMDTCPDGAANNKSTDVLSNARQVLKLVDTFAYQRHWMMHIGDQKGTVLKDFVTEFCRQAQSKFADDSGPGARVVELGTYCGYSSILMALTILEHLIGQSTLSTNLQKQAAKETVPGGNFCIYSVDVNPNHQAVAQKLVQLAGLEQYIQFILLPINSDRTSLVHALRQSMSSTSSTSRAAIDFLFIDHDKDLYLADLQQLEQNGFIQSGTHVAADNVIYFNIVPYLTHIRHLVTLGVAKSRMVKGQLEYIIVSEQQPSHPDTFEDGIGKIVVSQILCVVAMRSSSCFLSYSVSLVSELTVYLKDPRSVV